MHSAVDVDLRDAVALRLEIEQTDNLAEAGGGVRARCREKDARVRIRLEMNALRRQRACLGRNRPAPAGCDGPDGHRGRCAARCNGNERLGYLDIEDESERTLDRPVGVQRRDRLVEVEQGVEIRRQRNRARRRRHVVIHGERQRDGGVPAGGHGPTREALGVEKGRQQGEMVGAVLRQRGEVDPVGSISDKGHARGLDATHLAIDQELREIE